MTPFHVFQRRVLCSLLLCAFASPAVWAQPVAGNVPDPAQELRRQQERERLERERLRIVGTGELNNRGGLVSSAGSVTVADSLAGTGALKSQSVQNAGGTLIAGQQLSIEALGNLRLNVEQIDNTNNHLQTEQVQVGDAQLVRLYQAAPSIGDPNWLRNPSGIRWEEKDLTRFETDEVDIIYLPEGHTDHFFRYDITRKVSETRIVSTDPGRIVAGGSLGINANTLNNENSRIVAGGALDVTGGTVNNVAAEGQRITTDTGEVHERSRITHRGRDEQGDKVTAYANDDTQYQALIASGVTYARQWQLRPGVALTAAQMAQLTSDMVWLVEQTVTLPDGSTQQVLVPQVYAVVRPGDLAPNGALLSGGSVNINLSGDLANSGSILGRNVVALTAENVQNLGGRVHGNDVAIQARNDLDNIGGQNGQRVRLIARLSSRRFLVLILLCI